MVWKDGRLLLGERVGQSGEACWQFPGGRLEYGETVDDCAQREVLEETGIRIGGMLPCGFAGDVFIDHGTHYVTLFVSASFAGGELRVMEPDKCRRWQWFEHDRLPEPLFQPIRNYLKAVPDLSRFCVGPDTPAAARR